MKTRMLAVVALVAASLPSLAQEKPSLIPEKLPLVKEQPTLPKPEPCGTRVLWVDYWVPVQTLHLLPDFVRTEQIATYAVVYAPEERSYPTTILRPREVTREETVNCEEPVTTVDPVTGATTTCTRQVTRTR